MQATVIMFPQRKEVATDGQPTIILPEEAEKRRSQDRSEQESAPKMGSVIEHKGFMSAFRRSFISKLNQFQDGAGDIVARFFKQEPEYAKAIDSLTFEPATTLAPTSSGYDRQLLDRPDLPSVAPEMWADARKKGEKLTVFIGRVYAPWLGKGFTQADLRSLDPVAEMAWRHWKRTSTTPAPFPLPTKSEHLAAEAEALASTGLADARHVRSLAHQLRRTHTKPR